MPRAGNKGEDLLPAGICTLHYLYDIRLHIPCKSQQFRSLWVVLLMCHIHVDICIVKRMDAYSFS